MPANGLFLHVELVQPRRRDPSLEAARKDLQRDEALASLHSMSRIMAKQRKASALTARFSKSLASLRQRPSQAKVRATIQRLGNGPKPAPSLRLTISSRHRPVLATPSAVVWRW